MNTQQWLLMSPVADMHAASVATTDRASDLSGKRIGLFWNGKPGGDLFLDEVARQLAARVDGLEVVRMWEARPETRTSYGNSPESLQFMAQSADLVIAGSAD